MVLRRICDLWRDRRGAVNVFVALSVMPLIMALGVATDSALAFNLKARMQKAIDAAGLAAGRVAYTDHAVEDAREYFDANFPDGFLDSEVVIFDVQFSDDREEVFVTAEAEMPTVFMQIFGQDSVTVSVSTAIHRDNQGMELALVLDVTGSMLSGDHIGGLRVAATDLIEIIFGDDESNPNLWVSLVPYAASVNMGTQHSDWLRPTDAALTNPSQWAPRQWKGCVMARFAPYDTDDTPPDVAGLGGQPFDSFFYAAATDNAWNNGGTPPNETWEAQNNATGPNLGCGPPIVELNSSKQRLLDAIADLDAWSRGGTTGNLGLAWGWRSISPRWRGLWGGDTPAEMPLDYGAAFMTKVIVLLTDGQNQFYDWPGWYTWGGVTPTNGTGPGGSDYTGYKRLNQFSADYGASWTIAQARAQIDIRMAAQCAEIKSRGVIIYSIIFGTADAAAQTLFRNCATTVSHYFNSPDNATLAQTFHTIGTQLSNLRVAQ